MKERLRDQSAEVRSLSRRFTFFGTLAVICLLLAFVLSPQFSTHSGSGATKGTSLPLAQGSSSSVSQKLSKLTTQRKLLLSNQDDLATPERTSDEEQVDGKGDRPLRSAFDGASSSSESDFYLTAQVASTSSPVTAGAFFRFFILTSAATGLFIYSARLLTDCRFVCHYYTASGLTRPNGAFQLTTYVGSTPDPQAYRGGSSGGSGGFRLAPVSPTTSAGTTSVIVNSPSSHLFLFPLNALQFHIPLVVAFVFQQVAALRLWPSWLLLVLMAAQGFVFVVRARLLWNVISLGTSSR